ncbi:MAG: hypothetical protein IJ240_06870 [Clostridia bacterium]|nr:hypothetical protein [Clostridia bacterium]
MAGIGLEEAKKRLKQELARERDRAVRATDDRTLRQLTQLLYQRQADSLDCLDLVRAETEQKEAPIGAEDRAQRLILHPLTGLILLAGAFTLLSFRQYVWSGLCLVLAMLVELARLLQPRLEKGRERTPAARPVLTEDDLERLLSVLIRKTEVDRQDVAALFEARDLDADSRGRAGLADLYCALCELAADHPDAAADLDWPLKQAEVMLAQSGLTAVHYAEDTAVYFQTTPTNGAGQERYPAILDRESGALIKKGDYLERI